MLVDIVTTTNSIVVEVPPTPFAVTSQLQLVSKQQPVSCTKLTQYLRSSNTSNFIRIYSIVVASFVLLMVKKRCCGDVRFSHQRSSWYFVTVPNLTIQLLLLLLMLFIVSQPNRSFSSLCALLKLCSRVSRHRLFWCFSFFATPPHLTEALECSLEG